MLHPSDRCIVYALLIKRTFLCLWSLTEGLDLCSQGFHHTYQDYTYLIGLGWLQKQGCGCGCRGLAPEDTDSGVMQQMLENRTKCSIYEDV